MSVPTYTHIYNLYHSQTLKYSSVMPLLITTNIIIIRANV